MPEPVGIWVYWVVPRNHRPFLLWTTADLLLTNAFLQTTTKPTYLLATVVLLRAHEVSLKAHAVLMRAHITRLGHLRSSEGSTSRWWQPLWRWIALSPFLRMVKDAELRFEFGFVGLYVITDRGRWHLEHFAFRKVHFPLSFSSDTKSSSPGIIIFKILPTTYGAPTYTFWNWIVCLYS